MSRANDLTVAFLRNHPAEAARVLEQLDGAETTSVLVAVPGRVAAPVVARLPPGYAARCLDRVADDVIVRLLRRLSVPAAAALLRHFADARRQQILNDLPTAVAVGCRVLLRYPEDSVGALADTEVFVARPAESVREVLARIKSASHDIGDFVYVVDDERVLRACLRPASLLLAPQTMSIAGAEAADAPPLSAQAAPRSVRDHAGWTRYSTLPVVERNGRLVGSLRQGVLIQALEQGVARRSSREREALTVAGSAAWSLMSALLQSLVNELPGSRARSRP